jgi:hypothetical protein
MLKSSMIAAAAAVALAGTAIGTPAASAAPFLAPAVVQQGVDDPLLHQVRYDRRGYRGSGYRGSGYRGYGYRGYGYRGYGYRGYDWGSAAVAGILGFGLGAALTAPRYYAPYGYTYGVPQTYAYQIPPTYTYGAPISSAHVQWCQQRYRSYDLASDSFLSYDGNRYRCNSPYR